jgi:hypothetical protein
MAEELRYAIRCDGTKHKATLKRTCNGCSPITTYVPAPLHINHVTSQIVSHENQYNRIPMIFITCTPKYVNCEYIQNKPPKTTNEKNNNTH